MLIIPRNKLLVPRKIFFTKGVGSHKFELHSFELALRDAGIEKCNIAQVSSILPPGCQIISKNEGLKELIPGMLTFCVMARCSSNEPHRLIAASIGVAIPADPNAYGYLSEHHAYGETEKTAGDHAEDLRQGGVPVQLRYLPVRRLYPVLCPALRPRSQGAEAAHGLSPGPAKGL